MPAADSNISRRSTRAAEVPQPPIASCEEWGARQPTSAVTIVSNPANKIVIHHTAGPNSYDFSQEHAFAISRGIQNWHIDGNGWQDSGQHFTNSRGGWLTEGRHRSLETLLGGTAMVEGAHCPRQNTQAIGIENEGSYHVDGAMMPEEQWSSLVNLCAFICQQYGIPATQIYGHKDFVRTLCPANLYDRLAELRTAVGELLG